MTDTNVIINDAALRKKLEELSRKMQDMSPAMADIADEMARSVEDNFLTGGRPKWKSLKPSTKAVREKKGTWPGQVLVQSAQLKNSVHPFHGKDYAGAGTNKEYAKTMHFGAKKGAFGTKTVTQQVREHLRKRGGKTYTVKSHTRKRDIQTPWGNIPARNFMTTPKADIARYIEIISHWLLR